MDIIYYLRQKYPNHKIKYEPQKDCEACNGTGEHLNGLGEQTLCICTCVKLDGIGGIFKDFIDRELDAIRNG